MPMLRGSSNAVVSKNISEFHHGKTFAHTERKFGKKTADRQAIAAAMRSAGRSRSGRR